MDKIKEELNSAKIIGGIGAIIGQLPGIILLFIAIKKISDATNKKEIFNNFLTAFILEVIVIIPIMIISVVLDNDSDFDFIKLIGFLGLGITLLFSYVLFVVASYFKKKSFVLIGKELNIKNFEQAGYFWFLGAILLPILIGLIFLFISWIFTIIAFFSINEELPSHLVNENSESLK